VIVLFREDQRRRAENIVANINYLADEFNKKNEKDYKLVFSIGICSEELGERSLDYFLSEADKKMYMHKKEQKSGR